MHLTDRSRHLSNVASVFSLSATPIAFGAIYLWLTGPIYEHQILTHFNLSGFTIERSTFQIIYLGYRANQWFGLWFWLAVVLFTAIAIFVFDITRKYGRLRLIFSIYILAALFIIQLPDIVGKAASQKYLRTIYVNWVHRCGENSGSCPKFRTKNSVILGIYVCGDSKVSLIFVRDGVLMVPVTDIQAVSAPGFS